MGDGDAFVDASCHFAGGVGIVVGKGHETFDDRDGVFVVGVGHGSGVFAQGSGGVVGYQHLR